MIRITGIDHIQLAMPVGQEDAARRFYSSLLGLTEIPKPAALAGRGGAWFEGPGTHIHLGVEAEFRPARKAHPALRVADLEAARQVLTEAGVAVSHDETAPGFPRFYINDPFGNRLELIQDGHGFSR